MHETVKRVCVVAFDLNTRELDLATALLERLHNVGVLSGSVARLGFVRLIQATDDIAVDVPQYVCRTQPRHAPLTYADCVLLSPQCPLPCR